MTTRLVILGFLRSRPLYGYELKQMIEHVMGDWTNIAFGSIYYALGKLTDEGFVTKAVTEQEGGRPSRTVYQITDTGRAEFVRLLREVWQQQEQPTYDLDIALTFLSALSTEEVTGYLQARVEAMEGTLKYLDAHQAEEMEDEHVPVRLAGAVFDHHRRHLEAELAWTRELLRNVKQGVYDDEVKWLHGLFGGQGEMG